MSHTLIDAARAFAALLVLWHHSGYDFIGAQHGSLAGELFTLSIAPGRQAVIVFFVLSGYLVGSSWLSAYGKERGVQHYAVDRITRLHTALFPSLILTAVFDAAGSRLAQGHTAYKGALNYLDAMLPSFEAHFRPEVFAANAAFLQHRFGTFGSNSALWSLPYEFFYYCLFPIIFLATMFLKVSRYSESLLAIFLIGVIGWVAGLDILVTFPVWLLGMALMYVPPLRKALTYRPVLVWTFVVIAAVVAMPHTVFDAISGFGRLHTLAKDMTLAVVFTVWLYLALNVSVSEPPPRPLAWFAKHFAKFSYSLYLIHLPTVILLHAAILGDRRWEFSVASLAGLLVVDLTCLAAAYTMWFLFESRTKAVRGWLRQLLRMPPQPPRVQAN